MNPEELRVIARNWVDTAPDEDSWIAFANEALPSRFQIFILSLEFCEIVCSLQNYTQKNELSKLEILHEMTPLSSGRKVFFLWQLWPYEGEYQC